MSTTKVQGDMIDVDGATVAVVAAGDKFNFLDITDSLVKEDTVQGILDLAGGFTEATAVDAESGTSATIGSIPAGVKELIFSWTDISMTETTVEMDITLGDSGGLETSGYNSHASSDGGAGSSSTAALVVNFPGSNSATLYGHMHLKLVDASTNRWMSYVMHGREGDTERSVGSGDKALSGTLTQISLSGSTFDGSGGAIRLLYR